MREKEGKLPIFMTDKAPQKDIETISELLKFSGLKYRL